MNILPIFSTPCWQTEFENFDERREDFINILKKYREDNPSVDLEKVGYRSKYNLHETNEDLHDLLTFFCAIGHQCFSNLNFYNYRVAISNCWFDIDDDKDSSNHYNSSRDTLTGIFYLKSSEDSGKTILQNPSYNSLWNAYDLAQMKNEYVSKQISIEPKEGNIILFPSYVNYFTEYKDNSDEKMTIFFTLTAIEDNNS